ncbi:dTDP-4-dehydrorhamnose 3,5-epimerase [Breznakia sp. PF5-3]|uniref:dTDP-4-dehydrorhamnose 3,5-epimerase n=1 Tax=unclassified Breznakia TaxID=2623764 RepID=UPI002404C0BF|nr:MULTISPECIES: dTDP-4-dehydrorhamnose 3,5-epimerase [unclassified Breznakia]MDF9824992.1 dTDP-4-dehydrorhamnose 3,5-epimerase [Breznakia sp. PM6-1]MDF9835815.1 dTDP-4-dehydrorhamnose 3,5-epimerase [Breznakia sp. PF5-3]MDF9836933.1 dTDP-4-dehydrorhamnose 3,5-epimerase [Breznakia sp. PFB2-8]MDF9859879.1 dTDP-4-dehydrorhamnose 3,5-epimerase [Breznakia sp. PH5-24]
MKVIKTDLPEVLIVEPDCFGDHRGWFMETYSATKFSDLGIKNDFVQDNHSMSQKRGTLRGLHFQNNPHAQAKLVRCTRGKVVDVAVDIRKGSPTYKQWVSVELSDENKKMLFIPKGFAHGFLCLSDDVEFQYKVDSEYSKECDRGIRYDDPSIGVDWGQLLNGIEPILSEKDISGPTLEESDCNFIYEGDK